MRNGGEVVITANGSDVADFSKFFDNFGRLNQSVAVVRFNYRVFTYYSEQLQLFNYTRKFNETFQYGRLVHCESEDTDQTKIEARYRLNRVVPLYTRVLWLVRLSLFYTSSR